VVPPLRYLFASAILGVSAAYGSDEPTSPPIAPSRQNRT
jgi:hypothetical protein